MGDKKSKRLKYFLLEIVCNGFHRDSAADDPMKQKSGPGWSVSGRVRTLYAIMTPHVPYLTAAHSDNNGAKGSSESLHRGLLLGTLGRRDMVGGKWWGANGGNVPFDFVLCRPHLHSVSLVWDTVRAMSIVVPVACSFSSVEICC